MRQNRLARNNPLLSNPILILTCGKRRLLLVAPRAFARFGNSSQEVLDWSLEPATWPAGISDWILSIKGITAVDDNDHETTPPALICPNHVAGHELDAKRLVDMTMWAENTSKGKPRVAEIRRVVTEYA